MGGPKPSVVMVWLDCVAGDVFLDMYEHGKLPNLAEFFEGGVLVKNVVAVFPTVTESAEGGIISGFFSGETNLVGERYFSRSLRTVQHYKYNASAARDFEPRLRERTLDVLAGSTLSMGRIIKSAGEDIVDLVALKYEREGSLKIVRRRIEVAARLATTRRPPLLFFTISADFISHVHGRSGGAVKDFIRTFDEEFPVLVEALNKAYGKDNYAIFVFSDHGSADVAQHLDVPQFLAEHGFNPASNDLLIPQEETDSAALSNGRRMAMVYFAHPDEGWRKRPSYKILKNYRRGSGTVDLIELFAQHEGVQQVFVRKDEKSVVVVSKEGEGVIEYDSSSKRYRYRVTRGEDPLGYNMEPRWMSEEEWLKATYSTEYPDAVVQIYNMFKSENCGDLVLNAAPGWDFWEPWDIPYPTLKAAHGGLSKDEMITFVLARGPGIRKGEVEYARLLDIYATISSYYGGAKLAEASHAVERLLCRH